MGRRLMFNQISLVTLETSHLKTTVLTWLCLTPPHLKWAGPNSIMKAQYGQLYKHTWKEDLAKGFEECMRVLRVGGTLIFKWSDCQVNVKEILNAIPFNPLFGQRRGTTHWMTFVKFE